MSNISVISKGAQASPDYFTGTAWVQILVEDDLKSIGNVIFEPGARNNWHTHPAGQVLIVTEGIGYYQERGQAIQLINKGDVINIPADIEHWHGASPDSGFTHIAITAKVGNIAVNWLQHVSDAEYHQNI